MTGLPLVFLGGMLGSSHCVGMCGGIAMLVGGEQPTRTGNLARQLLFSTGRLFTYGALGAVAGALGGRLDDAASPWMNVRATLGLITGILLIAQGLGTIGVRFGRLPAAVATGCQLLGGFGVLLRLPGWCGAFLAGLFTGMIPCGLVYSFLALAGSTGDLLNGAILMLIFGLGTAPVMILTGWGSLLLRLNTRRRLLKLAACCVMLTGMLAVTKSVSAITLRTSAADDHCPFCAIEPAAGGRWSR